MRNAGDTPEALGLLMRAAELYPEEWQASFEIGIHFQGVGDLELARAWFRRATAVGDVPYVAARSLATACAGLGLVAETRRTLLSVNVEQVEQLDEMGSLVDYAKLCRDFPPPLVESRYAALEARFRSPLIDAMELEGAAADALNSGRGFAFVRLGDGEGALLSALTQFEIDYGAVMRHVRGVFAWRFLGSDLFLSNEFRCEVRGLLKKLCAVDVLGVPALRRIMHHQRRADFVAGASLLALVEQLLQVEEVPEYLTWPEVHWELLDNGGLRRLVEKSRGVLAITSRRQAVEFLRAQFPTKCIEEVAIFSEAHSTNPSDPEEACSSGRLFPSQYEEVRKALEQVDLRGKVVLVGAGPLGKLLVLCAKESGGVALDVGAVFDTLSGLQRPNVPSVSRL